MYFVAEFESGEGIDRALWRATDSKGNVYDRWNSAEAVTPVVKGAIDFFVTTWPNVFVQEEGGAWRRSSTNGELGELVKWGGEAPQLIGFDPPLWLTDLRKFDDNEEFMRLRNLDFVLVDAQGRWTPGQDSSAIEFTEGYLNVKAPFAPGTEVFAKLNGEEWFTIHPDWSPDRGPFTRLDKGVFWSQNPADPAVFSYKAGWWTLEEWETLHLLPQNLAVGLRGEHEEFVTFQLYHGNGWLIPLFEGVIEREPLEERSGAWTVLARTEAGHACLALVERRNEEQWGVGWVVLVEGQPSRASLIEAIPSAIAKAAVDAAEGLAQHEREVQEKLLAEARAIQRKAAAEAAAQQARAEAWRKRVEEGKEAERQAEAKRAAFLAAETPAERADRFARIAQEQANEEIRRIQNMRSCACAGTGLHVVGWRERYGVGYRLIPQHLYVVRGKTSVSHGTWRDKYSFTPYVCPQCKGANRLDNSPAWTQE